MLANELVENEERWLFYDDEETEVLVEVSNHIFLMIVKEAAHDIKLVLWRVDVSYFEYIMK